MTALKSCPKCGIPRTLTTEHRWGSNGTIYLANDPSHRMLILDNNALNHILDSIEQRIGLPVDNIVAQAKRKSGKHFMDAVLKGIKGIAARNLISSKVYQQLSKQVSILGLGSAEVVGYRRHKYLEGRVVEAYSAPAIAGDISGAFESVEKCSADFTYEREGDDTTLVKIKRGEGGRAEYADRFHYIPPAAVAGRNVFELCPVCRAPLGLGKQYSFKMERGLIQELKTGHRVVLIGIATLNNLFGELALELGEEIPRMIMSIEKKRVKDTILEKGKDRDTTEEGYLRYMKTLHLKGMGNGSRVSISRDCVEVRVDNPYYEPLVAGFLAGFYEATTGNDSRVEWSQAANGYTTVTMKKA